MIEDLTQSFEDAEKKKKDEEEEENKPDPLTQLVTTFCRGAMTERSGALQEDLLYMSYAQIAARSCGEEEEEGGEEEGGEEGESSGASIHVSDRKLRAQRNRQTLVLGYWCCYVVFPWMDFHPFIGPSPFPGDSQLDVVGTRSLPCVNTAVT